MAFTAGGIGKRCIELPSRDKIVSLCKEKGSFCRGFVYPSPENPIAYIKYAWNVTIGEAKTQSFVFEKLKGQVGVKVPGIYDAFELDGRGYIVMEYVDGETVKERLKAYPDEKQWIYFKVSDAVNQLLNIPLPEDAVIGPVGGGRAGHFFFTDAIAPIEYASIQELNDHLNKVLKMMPYKCKVDLLSDKLTFYYSDIHEQNFIITKDRQICVVDFHDAGFLPESLMSYALHRPRDLLAGVVGSIIPFPQSKNLDALSYAFYAFTIHSDPRLGLPPLEQVVSTK